MEKNWKIGKKCAGSAVKNDYISYLEAAPAEISSIVPVEEWINYYMVDAERGFGKENYLFSFQRKVVLSIVNFFEELIGKRLYLKADDWDFLKIELRLKKIVQELSEKKIISYVSRCLFRPDWPAIPYYKFNLNPILKPNGREIKLIGSLSGSGFTSNEAFSAALAETLERYSLCYWGHKEFLSGSYEDFENKGAIDPLEFKSFSDAQLSDPELRKRYHFNRQTKFDWLETKSLITGGKHLVPAQLIYIAYENKEKESTIRETTTNGAGAGESWERAAYSAICENVERDALMIHWLNKIAPAQIEKASITNQKINDILSRYKRCGIEVGIFDITTDIDLPTFAVVTLDRSGKGPAVHISNSADLNPEQAILHALLENIKIGPGLMDYTTKENFKRVNESYPIFGNILDRGVWWSQTKTIKDIEWIFRGPTKALLKNYKIESLNYKDKLSRLRELFVKANQEVYLADATSPIAKKCGLYVAMSLIPGFYPLYLNEKHKYLGVKRLYNLPVKLGYFNKPKKEEELNSVPHPMM